MNLKQEKIKVVVTGGAGFIGSHLARALVAKGYDVHVIDNLAGGKRENVPHEARFHKADIRNFNAIAPFFRGAHYVFHCAALPRVVPSILDPRTTHDVNVTGTLNVLIAARDAKVKRVIYSASSSAYGDHAKLPLREEYEPRPMHPYGLQKYMGEELMKLFYELYGLPTVSLRYFNVYGEGAPLDGAYALVISRFLKQRQEDKPLTIVPDGKQSRDFTHVDDVVRANILAARSRSLSKYEVINIGGGKNYTILHIAKIIGGLKVFIEPRVEPKHTRADLRKAQKLLKWKPEVALEEGVAELKKIFKLQ